jgi:hydroxymethylpyrimidine pyrophosphatase-like HAD family hydrolase
MEIYPKGINKGSALKLLCSELNLKLSEIIGFGNDYNDVHFLDIVGDAYLVSNSPEELKPRYNTSTSNNDNPLNEILKGYLVGS